MKYRSKIVLAVVPAGLALLGGCRCMRSRPRQAGCPQRLRPRSNRHRRRRSAARRKSWR